MIKIDNSLLQEIGLGTLPEAEKNSLLKHIYETLEMRVGMRLADQMTNEQLDEFERYFEAKDDAGAFKWLETNFPNYKDIVQQEFDKLKAEVGQSAPQILAAGGAAQPVPAGQQSVVADIPQPQQYAAAPQPMPMQPQPQYQDQYQPAVPQQPQMYPQPVSQPAPPQYQQYQPDPQQQVQQSPVGYPPAQPPAGPSAAPPQYPPQQAA